MADGGARVMTRFGIRSFSRKGDRIEAIDSGAGTVSARSYILATGGKSYPATGSTGGGYELAASLGHTVITPRPSLVPVILDASWPGEVEGLSLRNVEVKLLRGGRVIAAEFGEALFTDRGMSGPVVLDLSRTIGALPGEGLELSIDLKPALDEKTLDARVRRDLDENAPRLFKNSLGGLLPASLVPVIVRLSGVAPEKKSGEVNREERRSLCALMKGLRAPVAGLEGFDRAIVTAGGISLDEVDMRSMRSRLIENLFFAGEILDIDGPTGGFNLQLYWSTGYCAGSAAAGDCARTEVNREKNST
jgi:predicted Rossmann fold flavoprotein